MTAEEYIEKHLQNNKSFICAGREEPSTLTEDDALEAVDMAKREIAWEVHKMICAGASISEIDKWVTDICDF